MEDDRSAPEATEEGADRRVFLDKSFSVVMIGGMAAGYGTLAYQVGRFLYPAEAGKSVWQFVCTLEQLAVGDSISYTMPSGAKVVVARQAEGDTVESFVALSSICPHLGCQVHWEAVNDRFFCPCHNGAFDANGKPTEGPPAKANQQLTRFPLRVEGNLLLIQVPLESINVSQSEGSA